MAQRKGAPLRVLEHTHYTAHANADAPPPTPPTDFELRRHSALASLGPHLAPPLPGRPVYLPSPHGLIVLPIAPPTGQALTVRLSSPSHTPLHADAAPGRVVLVLDLDETLVHSSFVSMNGAESHCVDIGMDGTSHTVNPKP